MAKKRKPPEWERKSCGCVKTELRSVGKVLIRCTRHRDKPYKGKRTLCYFDDQGIVQQAFTRSLSDPTAVLHVRHKGQGSCST